MTYKEKVIEFVMTKNALVSLYTELDYITNEDIEEIKSWSEEDCGIVYKHMAKYIIRSINMPFSTIIEDEVTCPWCIYSSKIKIYYDCDDCGYGKRNGFCNNSGSKYRQIADEGGFAFLRKEDYLHIINKIG